MFCDLFHVVIMIINYINFSITIRACLCGFSVKCTGANVQNQKHPKKKCRKKKCFSKNIKYRFDIKYDVEMDKYVDL